MNQTNVLIIDDNIDNLNVLAQLLANEGVEHTPVSDPRKLTSVLEQQSNFEAVFLDLEMPTHSGYEVLEVLKSNPDFTNVPIVAYTVHVSEIDNAYQLGFDSFIGKPINPDKFPDQLARILNGEAVWETV